MKRNIYFPEWMDAKMAEYPDQNWSAVCQEAVAKRLALMVLPEYRWKLSRIAELRHEIEFEERELDALIEKHQ
jgi:hypothetical protein